LLSGSSRPDEGDAMPQLLSFDFARGSQWFAAIGRVLQEAPTPAEQASRLVAQFRQFLPGSELAACQLIGPATTHLVVIDGSGEPRADWADALELTLAKLTPLGGEIPLPHGGIGHAAGIRFQG